MFCFSLFLINWMIFVLNIDADCMGGLWWTIAYVICGCDHTLIHWNVIVYANVRLPMTLVANKLNLSFYSTLCEWDKSVNSFKCIFEETVTNCQFWKSFLMGIMRTNVLGPLVNMVLLNHNTVTNVDQICCWSTIIIFLIGNTYNLYHLHLFNLVGWLVWKWFPSVGVIA